MAEYEDNRISKFNAGVALTRRIDELQINLNNARYNRIAINPQTMTYNYEVMISACDGLLKESWSKLNTREKEIGEQTRKLVQNYKDRFPPFRTNQDGSQEINVTYFKKLMDLIDYYERLVRQFMDAHGMNSPDNDDGDEGF